MPESIEIETDQIELKSLLELSFQVNTPFAGLKTNEQRH